MNQETFARIVRETGERRMQNRRYIGLKLADKVPAAVETIIAQGSRFADPRHSFNWLPSDESGRADEVKTAEFVGAAIESLVSPIMVGRTLR